jgi:Carboxypeptidase regulatory-like domain
MSIDITEQLVLVTGRILHQGTKQPIAGLIQISAQEGWVAYKLFSNGAFAISGRPELLFPNLNSQSYTLNLKILAESQEFRQGRVEVPLAIAINTGEAFNLPINVGEVYLPADLVTIRGRVVQAKNPQAPIANATVEVNSVDPSIPSTVTDANGRYTLTEIAILAPAEINCSAAGFKPQKRILLLDFSKVINNESFRLAP